MTTYVPGTIVSHNNDVYVCVAGHTSSAATEPGVGASWATYWKRSESAASAHAASHKRGGSDPLLLSDFGLPNASVDFNKQQAVQFRIENRTSDPASPAAGQIWLRTDL